jgi:hypothetical protein
MNFIKSGYVNSLSNKKTVLLGRTGRSKDIACMIKSTSLFHLSLEKESNLTGIRRIGKALPPIGNAKERTLHFSLIYVKSEMRKTKE